LNNLFNRRRDKLYNEGAMRLALLLAALLCIPGRATAQSDDEGRSRAHYDAGRALFVLGNYPEALREFTSGYQLSGRPKFLLNIAQCYRRLGEPRRAREMLEQYLQRGAPTDAERADISRILAELDREPDRDQRAQPAASPPPQAVSYQKATSDAPLIQATPAPRRSFIRRHWWIIPVSVVAAAGLAVGIYFAARPSVDCGSLGCVP
jgi:tetratricopeptide (TPR) repeat protein